MAAEADGRSELFSILVVGSGAREHALVLALQQSPSVSEVWAAPGNPGIAAITPTIDIPASDINAIADWAAAHRVGLVVVGPEAPLAAGLADRVSERGISVFGPTRAAAELEWSKAFAKAFMVRHGIPTAAYGVVRDFHEAVSFARESTFPIVVKADGLAAGKGVIVCQTAGEAEAALRAMLLDGAFGAAGRQVVIEEFVSGDELSVTALVDGERFVVLPLARDYKRLQDGDRGPNTGGMGSFAPVTDITSGLLGSVRTSVLEPTIQGLREEGRPFRGALYVGLMLTAEGPKVLEFNCRFGDPETQVILPLVAGDLAKSLRQCAEGRLDPGAVEERSGAAVCVVLASEGYPERPRAGDVITGIAEAEAGGANILHAGTAKRDGELVTNGGRVLSVVATGDALPDARRRAYQAAECIAFSGMQFRRDVARVEESRQA